MKTKIKTMTSTISTLNAGGSRKIRHATPESLLEFCNEVRAAGNASLLPALLPSKKRSQRECLVARAVNFNSRVCPTDSESDVWGMFPIASYPADRDANVQMVRTLAATLGLRVIRETPGNSMTPLGIRLPKMISNAAEAFDDGAEAFQDYVR